MDNVSRIKERIKASGFNVGIVDKELNNLSEKQLKKVLKVIELKLLDTIKFKDNFCEIEYPDDNNELDVTLKDNGYYY